jgi:DNA-binding XRE family transcriptional regulator
MDPEKKTRLEAAGYKFPTVGDWLGLSGEQRQLAEFRARVVAELRRRRVVRGLSQSALAKLLGSSQSRVAKVEAGATDVSLDLMLRAFFAVGGRVEDLAAQAPEPARPAEPAKVAQATPRAKTARKAKAGA